MSSSSVSSSQGLFVVQPAESLWMQRGNQRASNRLDIRQKVEIFIVFVRTALSFPDRPLRFDKSNLADPFHDFESKLIFDA